jgi:hypothetical protein
MKTTTLVLSTALFAALAHAGEDRPPAPLLRSYDQECSACHVAYAPGLLPAASWSRLMEGLPLHFGTDASVEPATRKTITTWLQANASRRGAEPPQDRITRSAWFHREHDEVPPDAWQRPAVRSASNCAACHTGAAHGDFEEHGVRIPQ